MTYIFHQAELSSKVLAIFLSNGLKPISTDVPPDDELSVRYDAPYFYIGMNRGRIWRDLFVGSIYSTTKIPIQEILTLSLVSRRRVYRTSHVDKSIIYAILKQGYDPIHIQGGEDLWSEGEIVVSSVLTSGVTTSVRLQKGVNFKGKVVLETYYVYCLQNSKDTLPTEYPFDGSQTK
jgi:hypothetical protein